MPQKLTATQILLGLNVVAYLLWHGLRPDSSGTGPFALYLPDHPDFGLWQYVTSLFMHANLSHLFMNMFGLFVFGSALEKIWGAKRFVLFYLLTGLGAGLIYTATSIYDVQSGINHLAEQGFDATILKSAFAATDSQTVSNLIVEAAPPDGISESMEEKLSEVYWNFQTPVVGASGALYGVLTAFGLLFPNAKLALIFLPVPVAAKYFIPALLMMDLFSGLTGLSLFGGGIAHFAHLGGALIGFLLMLHWRELSRPQILQSMSPLQ